MILSKNLIISILLFGIITAIFSFITLRPEMFYLCGLILTFSIVTLIVDNKTLNSMAIAGIPMYVIIIPFQPITIHFVIFSFTLIVLFLRWENSSPGLIIFTSVFYIFYGVEFWLYVPSLGDWEFYKALFTPLPMGIYFSLQLLIAVVIKYNSKLYKKKKSWW